MTRTRYKVFEDTYPYFLTSTVVAWLPIFAFPQFVDIIFNSWRFLQKDGALRIYGYVIMENHLHWIALGDDLSQVIARFKSFTARRIIDALQTSGFSTFRSELRYFKSRHKIDQTYQLWQEGSHPQQLQNAEMMIQKLEYMHNNPVKRGYVDDAMHWRYSSARNYAGLTGLIDVVTDWQF
jgi:REP element-mobilizing transposase RayT